MKKVDREAQERARNRVGRIGASTAAACLGLHPFRTQAEAQAEILGTLAPEESDGVGPPEIGTALEPVVAQLFEVKTGKKLRRQNRLLHHREFPFITADLDRIVKGESATAEIKTGGFVAARGYGRPGSADIPRHHNVQVQIGLGLSRREVTYVPLLASRQVMTLDVYEVPFDKPQYEEWIEQLVDWWVRHIVDGEPAPVTCAEDVLLQHPHSNGEVVRVDNELLATVAKLNAINEAQKRMALEAEMLQLELQTRMGSAQAICDSAGELVTWRDSMGFDEEAFSAAHPELAAEFRPDGIDKNALESAHRKLYKSFKTIASRSKKVRVTKRGQLIRALPEES